MPRSTATEVVLGLLRSAAHGQRLAIHHFFREWRWVSWRGGRGRGRLAGRLLALGRASGAQAAANDPVAARRTWLLRSGWHEKHGGLDAFASLVLF